MQPEIRIVPDRPILCVTCKGLVNGLYGVAAQQAFSILIPFAKKKEILNPSLQFLGICPDNPATTPHEECRFQAAFVAPEGVEPEGDVELLTLYGGRFAVFLHKGTYANLGETWRAAYRDWLPTSGEQPRSAPPFECYLNDPSTAEPDDLLTELFVPIQ